MAREVDVEPIKFRGGPLAVEAVLDMPPAARKTIKVEMHDDKGSAPVRVLTSPVGSTRTLARLVLPSDAPVGVHRGSVTMGDLTYPAEIEVGAMASVDVIPSTIEIVGDDRSREVLVTVVNTGNVVVAIDTAAAFGLFPDDGLEAAIAAGFRDTEAGGRRLERMADEAASRFGGLARVKVSDGAGDMKPGDRRDITASIQIGDNLAPGVTYRGSWSIGPTSIAVVVQVGATRRARARARKEP